MTQISYQAALNVSVQQAVADAEMADSSGLVVSAANILATGGAATTPAQQEALAAAGFGAIGSVFGPVGTMIGSAFGKWFADNVPAAAGCGILPGYVKVAKAVNAANMEVFHKEGVYDNAAARNAWAAAANAVAGILDGAHPFYAQGWGGGVIPALIGQVISGPECRDSGGWTTWALTGKHSDPQHDLHSMAIRLTHASLAAWYALHKQGVGGNYQIMKRPVQFQSKSLFARHPVATTTAAGGGIALVVWGLVKYGILHV